MRPEVLWIGRVVRVLSHGLRADERGELELLDVAALAMAAFVAIVRPNFLPLPAFFFALPK